MTEARGFGASHLWRAVGLLALAALALVPSFVTPQPQVARAAEPPPNIIIIVTDDQRGGLQIMPELRKAFIEQGRGYPHAFATTPFCCPSRASIMTGRYEHNHGVTDSDTSGNLDQNTTLQRYLHDAGYRNGMFGKYLNRWPGDVNPPFFDDWAMKLKSRTYRGGFWNINGTQQRISDYSTSFTQFRAESFILNSDLSDDAQPWFAYVAPQAPHSPYSPQRKYRDARIPLWHPGPNVYEFDQSDKPVTNPIRPEAGIALRSKQFRTLLSVDDLVDGLMTTLRFLGEDDNTVVVYTSDNGMMWGEHGWLGKQRPYSESVEVPMFMRWPETIEAGTVDPRLVGNIDIAPTLLDAVGLPQDPQTPMDGRSLLDDSWNRDRILLESKGPLAFSHWASDWRPESQYTEYYDDNGLQTFGEYYDLVNDPWQMDNLLVDSDSGNDPDVLALKGQLELDKSCKGDTCP